MANYIKARLKISMVEKYEKDFEELSSIIKEGDEDGFSDISQTSPDYCWVDYFEDPPYFNGEEKYMIVSLYFKAYEFSERDIAEFAEYLNDNVVVSIQGCYCDEYEDTTSVGVISKTFTYDVETAEAEGCVDEDDEYFGDYLDSEEKYYKPKDDKQRHEIFLMSWNGVRCEGHDEDFFNQLGLDDKYFYVQEGEDFSFLPDFEEWLEQLFPKLKEEK